MSTSAIGPTNVNQRKIRVAILNPSPTGSRYTSMRNAQRFVRRGRARWAGDRLEFIDKEANDRKAIADEIQKLRPLHLAYDRVQRVMTLDEIAAIPVVCPSKLLIYRGSGRHARN